MLWTDGSVPFPFAKTALAYLPTTFSVASRPPFSFLKAQYAQVFLLKPAPLCKLFVGLGSTIKSATSFLFSPYLTLALSSPLCSLLDLSFYLKLCQKLFSPVLSGYNGSPDTCFFRTTTRLMSWPERERNLCPQQCLVVTLLLSLVSTFLFSRTGGVLSHLNSLTHRFSRFPPINLCFYVMLSVISLAFAATDTAFCLAPISLGLAESRILPAALANTHPRTPLISFCTVQLQTLGVARSLAIFCPSTTSVPGSGELLGFWGFMVFRHQLIPRKGSGNNNNNSETEIADTDVTKEVSKCRRF